MLKWSSTAAPTVNVPDVPDSLEPV
jgi:hypothetical protein